MGKAGRKGQEKYGGNKRAGIKGRERACGGKILAGKIGSIHFAGNQQSLLRL